MPRLAPLALALTAVVSLALHAHEPHDHAHGSHNAAAHQHGVGTLDIVIDGQQLLLELSTPAADLLGFEHAPHNQTQRDQLDSLMNTLRQPEKLFALPAAAQCSLDSAELHSPLFALHEHSSDDAHAQHEHHHGHDDEHQHEHADITAQYSYSCITPTRLEHLDVTLFDLFPGSEKLILQAITPQGQQGGELTVTDRRVRF
ncbi:DUF2796 domain-containing protein [Pseudomonas sp. MYb185]|uniref:DUF2796 domain-containing protein n=1 Tax=Pseudomonas sp. MYb185 TaxID=1848729 RepID=UPI000CFAEC84|nr:DUF2796 domain-containing protein [Pseudomonas sp. MYb185]NLY57003.1 DUF2796 domain-containing protein [Gammaproteobacteria bacterium]PRB79404.1 zinc-binding protein [Pseudomonas sp. MYb185]